MYQYRNRFIFFYEPTCLSQNSFKYQFLLLFIFPLNSIYSISASFLLFKSKMSSKKTYLITTFHHSLLNLNSNISKQKLLIKNTNIFDWDGHTKEK